MKKKKVVIVLIVVLIFVFGVGVVKVTPKAVSILKEETKHIIDYTLDSLYTDGKRLSEIEDQKFKKINDGFSDMMIYLQIGDDEISINTNYDGEVFEVESLYTDVPIEIGLKRNTTTLNDEDKINIIIEDKNIAEENSIFLDSLNKDNYIKIELEYDNYERTYFVQTLPSSFPKIEKTGLSKYEGDYYSNVYTDDKNYIYKMSNSGEILYYKSSENSIYTFTKWNIDGKQRYSYFVEDNLQNIEIQGSSFGDFVILNENYEEIDKVRTLPSNDYEILTNKAESHDFIIIDDNHYMLMDYVLDTPNAEHLNDDIKIDTRVQAAYVQEIKDNEVVWEWISTDYKEFYDDSVENNDYSNSDRLAADYVHINSIFIDAKDDNIIMSLRTQDSVVKIDKLTKEILWRFGGKNDDFNLSNKQKPSKQHHATITDAGNLIIFDNGTANKQTRIIEVNLNENEKKVEDYKEFQIDNVHSTFAGSVQKIDEDNDVFLIGWGINRQNQYSMMSEIDFKNNKILTEVVEGEIENSSYRFLKFE